MAQRGRWARLTDYVYRVVISTYPTPDGKPFAEQEYAWADYGHNTVPDWAPSAELMDEHFHRSFGDGITEHWEGHVAPEFKTNRKFLSRSGAGRWAKIARDCGCEAHLERAVIGPWE